jgi:hypothetical protein
MRSDIKRALHLARPQFHANRAAPGRGIPVLQSCPGYKTPPLMLSRGCDKRAAALAGDDQAALA